MSPEDSPTILHPRPRVTAWLKAWQGRNLVKVLTGVRRCGKSTALALYAEALRADGVPPDRIVRVNYEDPDEPDYPSWRDAWAALKQRLPSGGRTHVLLDEVQRVPDWERLVDGLHSRGGLDVTVTGSNGSFLSGELATYLTGRYVECRMYPLSFAEYRAALAPSVPSPEAVWRRYAREGGFPLALTFGGDTTAVDQYLQGVLDTILYRDILERRGFQDAALLKRLMRFALDNVGSPLSVNRIVNAFRADGVRAAASTVDEYLGALCDSYLLCKADRYDIRGKAYLKTLGKYYAVDPGLRFALLGTRGADVGHLLENILYLELRRRYREVYVGWLERGEVDFVTFEEGSPRYWQVAATVRDPATLRRELAPLRAIHDHCPKTLLVLDPDPDADFDGIRKLNALAFLSGAPCRARSDE